MYTAKEIELLIQVVSVDYAKTYAAKSSKVDVKTSWGLNEVMTSPEVLFLLRIIEHIVMRDFAFTDEQRDYLRILISNFSAPPEYQITSQALLIKIAVL